MAFSNILRRCASAVVPLASRVTGTQRYPSSAAITSAINRTTDSPKVHRSLFPSVLHYFSSSERPSSDLSLLKIIESEIKCAEESDIHDQVPELPDGFPFKIQDNSGLRTISLSREYQDETIKVEVHMPDHILGNEEEEEDNENGTQSSIPLVVSVRRHRGPCLEFGCTAFPDEISIDCLSVKDPENSEDQLAYEGPDFSDLDENLQKAFHKYLEIRGLKPSTTNFLLECMIVKDNREYLMWLKKVKKLIEA